MDDYNPQLGTLTFYVGDHRQPIFVFPEVTAFSAVNGQLMQNGNDMTATMCGSSPSYSGNTLTGHDIGNGGTPMTAGAYIYYMTGTYDGGKKRTWYWIVNVLAIQ